MKHKYIKKFLTCSLVLVMVITVLTQMTIHANAEELKLDADTIYVDSADDLIEIAKASRGIGMDVHQFENQTIILQNDIDLTGKTIPGELGVLTIGGIGTEYLPFKGTFDGNGYTITGLNNQKSILPDHNIGLFSETEGAILKNLILDQANVNAAYEAGILVGEANDTFIENVVVKNSQLKVQPANNVVSLITNLGTNGGAIAGKISNSVLYNCESVNTTVYNNTTSGITGVGGERLDLGGLVGYSINSTIEYSRVRGGRVKNEYNIAVGALGGKELMTGGIVGEMNKTKVIDCFSTADLISYGRNIVSVGSGIAGYTGGIAGVIYGTENEIIRSHFAGTLDSYQYNAIAVIPIIQYDVNLAGLVGTDALNSSLKVEDSYYRYDKLKTNDNNDVPLLGFSCDSIANSKGLSSDEYKNKSLWKEAEYDFFAEEVRQSAYPGEHYNQWVMDYELQMPIHGHSLSATFDFPGAATVSISKQYSDWILEGENETPTPVEKTSTISTNNPYQFAVMGYDTNQKIVTLNASTKEVSDFDGAYKFLGWYKKDGGYQGDSIPELPSFFKNIVSNDHSLISSNKNYLLSLEKNNVDNNNDLYIAHYQAKVLFHNSSGNIINSEESTQYFDYQDRLPKISVGVPEGYTFYGWTSIKNEDGSGAYIGITTNQLSEIKAANAFYQEGDFIEQPMKLYPIFTNYLTNIHIQVEGYNVEDSNNDTSKRPGVAEAKVIADQDTGKVSIQLIGKNNGELPDGYRFLGWYKIESENAEETGQRVSKDMTYVLPDDLDLTANHYYIARFEYRVDYMIQEQNSPFASIWQTFNSNFQNIDGPEYYWRDVNHWSLEEYENHGVNETITDNFNGKINKSLTVYAHSQEQDSTPGSAHDAYITSDFPESGNVSVTWDGAALTASGDLLFVESENSIIPGYQFKFWTVEDKNFNETDMWDYKDFEPKVSNSNEWENAFKAQTSINHSFIGVAHVTAKIQFNGVPNQTDYVVERRYKEGVFLKQDNDNSNYYTFASEANQKFNGKIIDYVNDEDINISSKASPSDQIMFKDGYLFLGWIDKNSMLDSEFKNIYGTEDNIPSDFATIDARRAIPYLIDEDAVVTKPMDLYPVYVKVNFETSTNIKESGITEDHESIALPSDPKSTSINIDSSTGLANITFNVDNNQTKVLKNNNTDDTLYQFKYLEYINHLGETVRIYPINENGTTVTVNNILLGPNYKFIAYYEPCVLTYHVNDSKKEYKVRNSGSFVGQQPDAEFDVNQQYVFKGWSSDEPIGDYHIDSEHKLVNSNDYVTNSMELWAVYNTAKIKVTSNIDEELNVSGSDSTNIRGWRKTDSGGYELFAQETVSINDQNYVFVGWKNFVNDQEYITKSTNYSVNPLEEKNYIAIYEQSVTVTYHFSNEESREVQVVANERSFVEEISDGDNETVSMIDAEIMQEMINTLEKNDLFIQWQWNNNGVMVDWNDFFYQNIDSNMDLYPVVYHLNGKDSEDNPINDDMTFIYDKNNSGIPVSINAYLNVPYTQNKLTVILEKSCFNNGVIQKNPVPKMPVKLWVANENMQVPDEGNNGDDDVKDPYIEYETKPTDKSGNAVFEFNGQLILTKKIENQSNSNDVFIFKIEKLSLDGHSTQQIEIPLDMDGQETNTITLTLPCGKYKVIEDESWAWRYSVTLELGSVDEKGYISIIPYYKNNPRTITFTNTEDNSKWFNNTDYEHNVYNQNQGGNQ